MQRIRKISIGLLILCAAAAYLPVALHGEFISLDDPLLITGNNTVQSFTPHSVWKAFTSYDPELYIPLTLVSYQVEIAIAGLVPQIFHIVNLLLHIGSTVLIFLLAGLLLRDDRSAWIVAALFALHPLNTEAVVWASARKDLLSTIFFLLSLYLYEQSHRGQGEALRRWSIIAFLAALFSKVTVIALPIVLLLLDYLRGERLTKDRMRLHLPYWILSIAFAFIAVFGKTRNLSSLSPLDYLIIGCKSIIFYLGKILWPFHFSVSYVQVSPVTLLSSEFAVPVVLVLLLLILLAVLAWRGYRIPVACTAFFLVTVEVNFFNVWKNGTLFYASDRYAYIPAIGIFLLLGFSMNALFARIETRFAMKVWIGLSTLLVAVYLPLAFLQGRVWLTSESLYRHALAVSPESVTILNNLGDLLTDSGREEDGLSLFIRATEIDPRNIVALTNVGNMYRERGDLQKAEEYYRKATTVVPVDPFPEHLMGHYLLGEQLINRGEEDEGLEILAQAVTLAPNYAEPYFNLALMLEKLGRKPEALSVYEQAVAANGDYLIARYHLANLLAEQGRLPEAIEQLEAIVSLNPRYEKAQEHLTQMRAMVK